MDKLTQDHLTVMRYIDKHPTVVLGTLDDYHRPHGSVVHAISGDHQTKMHVYFLTKVDTEKYQNILIRPAVSITSYDEDEVSTLQARGHAEVERSPHVIDKVIKQLARSHANTAEWLPPIAKMNAGNYVMIGITITHARLGEFKNKPAGSKKLFTEAN
jgi:general stress protein 26